MDAVKSILILIFCILVLSKADTSANSGRGCMSYYCGNGETCVPANNAQGYMCCKYENERYVNSSGQLCFPCATNPCGNSGSCHTNRTDPHGYLCYCADGTTGHSCADTSTNSSRGCMSYPCRNGETCVPAQNAKGYMCCKYENEHYVNSSGQLCFPCDTNPCGNNGSCYTNRTDPYGYLCYCADGTTGHSCAGVTSTQKPSTSVVGCMSHPCMGMATCVPANNIKGYMCCEYTEKGYFNSTGHPCFPCNGDPCGRNGTCKHDFTNANGYICHCPDGSIGQSCSGCGKNEMQCNITKSCIPKSYKCDDYLDCGDDDVTDEIDCGQNGCRSDQFLCKKNQRCIPKSWKCDGQLNCGGMDFSDETGCTNTCNSEQFLCGSGKCISDYDLCDGKNDCKDNTDEKMEICVPRACSRTDFSCGKGHCIPATEVCDGKINCGNGEDENSLMCGNLDCKDATKFRCANGACVTKSNVCDGYYSCYDYSDERADFCYAWRGTFGNVPKWLKITANRTTL